MITKIKLWFHIVVMRVLPPRAAEKRFVNPYAMTDATTPKLQVQSRFKNGRFILDPAHNPYSAIKPDDPKPDENPTPPKKKEPGFSKACIDVFISDIEYVSGETRRKAKRKVTEEEAHNHVLGLITKEKSSLFTRKKKEQPVLKEPIVITPPAVEPAIVMPIGSSAKVQPVTPTVNPNLHNRMFDPIVQMLKKNMIKKVSMKPVVVEVPFVDEPVTIMPDLPYDVTEVYKKQPEDNDEWIEWATEPKTE